MRNQQYYGRGNQPMNMRMPDLPVSRKMIVGIILMMALLAFEIFNFDTTRYALSNLLGEVHFLGLPWAAILALAFCSIDFAGLIRLFTPERGAEEPKEVWYLMGAWLLGATMNAIMTWWAVSLTLLNHDFGNEVLSRAQLLQAVPIFVAVLVWLTRILFIGAFTVAGDQLFDFSSEGSSSKRPSRQPQAAPLPVQPGQKTVVRAQPKRAQPSRTMRVRPKPTPPPVVNTTQDVPDFMSEYEPAPEPEPEPQPKVRRQTGNSRVKQRPPRPRPNGGLRRAPSGMHARPSDRH